jgi:hypothetical protein
MSVSRVRSIRVQCDQASSPVKERASSIGSARRRIRIRLVIRSAESTDDARATRVQSSLSFPCLSDASAPRANLAMLRSSNSAAHARDWENDRRTYATWSETSWMFRLHGLVARLCHIHPVTARRWGSTGVPGKRYRSTKPASNSRGLRNISTGWRRLSRSRRKRSSHGSVFGWMNSPHGPALNLESELASINELARTFRDNEEPAALVRQIDDRVAELKRLILYWAKR